MLRIIFFAYSDSLGGLLVYLNISLHISAEDWELGLQGFFSGISHCSTLQRSIFILWFLSLYYGTSWETDGKAKTDSRQSGPSRWPGAGCLFAAFVGKKKTKVLVMTGQNSHCPTAFYHLAKVGTAFRFPQHCLTASLLTAPKVLLFDHGIISWKRNK